MESLAIDIQNLTKIYKGELGQKDVVGITDLSLQVHSGEVFAFIGPNGAGKSTTIKLINRLIFPTKGEISLFGENIRHIEALKRIGFLPEQPSLYGHLKGVEFLDFIGQLYGMEKSDRKKRIELLIEKVGIKDRAKHLIRSYSRGMTQRLALAQAMIHDPDCLILDEPMANLDPVGRKDFRDLILDLKGQGKTIFFSSHILSDAEMIADRVGMVNQGELVKTGKLHDLLSGQNQFIELVFSKRENPEFDPESLDLDATVFQDQLMIRASEEMDLYDLIRKMKKHKLNLISCIPQKRNLESLFIEKMSEVQ